MQEAQRMGLQALSEKQNDGWISVKDRLPEERSGQNQEFNVMVKGFSRATALCYMGNGAWEDDIGAVYNVTHWRPLPEPPKEESL